MDSDFVILQQEALNETTSPSRLWELALRNRDFLAPLVALNPNTPAELLQKFIGWSLGYFVGANPVFPLLVLEKPNIISEIFQWIQARDDSETSCNFVLDAKTSVEFLEKLSTTLELEYYQGELLPMIIDRITHLKHLSIECTYITKLPSKIGLLTNLTELNLYSNQLPELPSEIGLLTNLKKLNLSKNRLTTLPSEINLLTNLTELDLSNNHLTNLPPEIGQLTNLTKLELSGNQLTVLPPEIFNLTNLVELNLSNNKFLVQPPGMGQLTKLGSNLRI